MCFFYLKDNLSFSLKEKQEIKKKHKMKGENRLMQKLRIHKTLFLFLFILKHIMFVVFIN